MAYRVVPFLGGKYITCTVAGSMKHSRAVVGETREEKLLNNAVVSLEALL